MKFKEFLMTVVGVTCINALLVYLLVQEVYKQMDLVATRDQTVSELKTEVSMQVRQIEIMQARDEAWSTFCKQVQIKLKRRSNGKENIERRSTNRRKSSKKSD